MLIYFLKALYIILFVLRASPPCPHLCCCTHCPCPWPHCPVIVLPIFIVPALLLLLLAVPSSLSLSALFSALSGSSLSPPPLSSTPPLLSSSSLSLLLSLSSLSRARLCQLRAVPLFLLDPAKMDGEQERERERDQRLSVHQ